MRCRRSGLPQHNRTKSIFLDSKFSFTLYRIHRFKVKFFVVFMYRSIPKPPMPPPRANPRAFDFFEKFWSNSPLCCQFRRSNAPPVRTSKRVKSPTLQACEAHCGNQFCKIFSHYEFLVQLVFPPHFKQRHIPRQNYIKRQRPRKNPRGIDKNNELWTRLTCWIKELRNPFASDRWQPFWHESQMSHRAGPTVRSLTRVKCPGIARGGMGGFGIDWYIISKTYALIQDCMFWY